MKRRTVMGTLLTDFRFRRNEARKQAEEDLWKRNKLSNPTKRGGYEIRESSVHAQDGSQIIELQLWKKVDSIAVKISVDVKSEEIVAKEGESIEELMSDGKK